MASSSHQSHGNNLSGLEMLVSVPPVKRNEAVLDQESEQSPILICLKKHVRKELKSKAPEEGVSDEQLSFKLPKNYRNNLFIMVEQEEGSPKKVFWSRLINFKLSDDCLAFILKMDEKAPVVPNVEHLTVYERLEGWHIEIRHRDNFELQDKYFYHQKSKGKFRSFIEVENYIIHGHFPQKPQQQKPKKRKKLLALTLVHKSSKEASRKKKKTCQCSKITKKHKKFVEKYLAKTWYNFLNSGKQEREVHSSTNEKPMTPLEKEVEHKEKGTQVPGDSTTRPSENAATTNEGPSIRDIFLVPFVNLEEFLLND